MACGESKREAPDFTKEQRKAIERLSGPLFIAAGAGSGKTAVVAYRFVDAIAAGEARVDEILTITFTRKAAAEMMCRIREVLRRRMSEEDDPGRLHRLAAAYRDIESARISTIDSFCSGILRSHALAAGIDPEFTTFGEDKQETLARECLDSSLYRLVEEHGDAATEMIATYDPRLDGGLFDIIFYQAYDKLRTRGRPIRLPVPDAGAFMTAAATSLVAAMEDFETAVKREGVEGQKTVLKNLEAVAVLRQAVMEIDPERRLDLVRGATIKRSRSKKARSETETLRAACETYKISLHSRRAARLLDLLNNLLLSFDAVYTARKHERGVLDFGDLSLLTSRLLRQDPRLAARVTAGYRMIMVDEFQDTNALQHDIVTSIAGDHLMMVGDANQSIYGWRNAEVELFQEQERRALEGEYRVPLAVNFRSQPEILSFVDAVFKGDDMLAGTYLKLEPGAEIDPRPEDFRVEALLVDTSPPGGDTELKAGGARAAEAATIARRLKQLFHGGGYEYGDAAILVRDRKGVEAYRDALERQGIPTHLATGVGYYKREELGDVINMLKLMVSPGDDVALAAVLRSPLVGAADDTLFWLRDMAGVDGEGVKGPLWTVLLSERCLEHFPQEEQRRLKNFVNDLEGLRREAPWRSLAATVREVVFYNDYAVVTAAGDDGKQRLANLMRLTDLAAGFEAVEGHDLDGFVRFLSEKRSEQARQPEPPIAEEGAAAVRIMTMHQAKGLEFPLVVLPKLGEGKKGHRDSPAIRLDRHGKRVGLRLPVPGEKQNVKTFDYLELEEEDQRREAQEEKRLHYVAMTRAGRHLVLAGSARLDKPAREGGSGAPLDWVRSRLGLDRASRPDLDGLTVIREIKGAAVGLSVLTDADALLRESVEGAPAAPAAPPALNPDIFRLPGVARHVPPVISPTALDDFNACPRRYFLDHVLHAGELLEVHGAGARAAGADLRASDMGTLVHGLLEAGLPPAAGEPMPARSIDQQAARLLGPGVKLTAADRRRAAFLTGNLVRAHVFPELQRAAAEGRLKREQQFTTLVDATIVQGKIDVLIEPAGARDSALVVDYKTGAPGDGSSPGQAARAYHYQMAAYALAAHRLYARPVRVVLVFLGAETPVEAASEFKVAEMPALAGEIGHLVEQMSAGGFKPLGGFDRRQCPWCAAGPNGAGICHSRAGGEAEQPQ